MEQYWIEQGRRLRELIKELKINQLSLAKRLQVSQPNISKVINGENKISAELLNRITEQYKQVNLHWLLTGQGDMFIEEKPGKTYQVNETEFIGSGDQLPNLAERLQVIEERLAALEKAILKSTSKIS